MAKQARMENVDRLGNLPDSILSHILSFLSTKEAVGTSILSTRWRYLFALVTTLDFELDDFELHDKGWQYRIRSEIGPVKSFMGFVDTVLFFHNRTKIEKFRLKCGRAVDPYRIRGWLSAALWHGIQHLDLDICVGNVTTLPHALFTCKTIVTLKLDISFVLNVPNDVCFPNLKTLHLKSIEFPNDDSINRLLSSCICLEDMIIEDCFLRNIRRLDISHNLLKRLTIVCSGCYRSNYWIVIDAPMLVHFKYSDFEASGYSLENLKSLVSADIDIIITENGLRTYNNRQMDATPLFRGISNVESLNLSPISLELLLSCESVPVFPKLVQLKICYDRYDPPKSSVGCYYHYLGKGIATLLRDLPELKKFTFFQEVVRYLPKKVHYCFLFNLKAIEISEFIYEEDCIEMVKYFLKKAGVLEKLTIRTRSYLSQERKFKIAEELLASPRKSKQCCILIG